MNRTMTQDNLTQTARNVSVIDPVIFEKHTPKQVAAMFDENNSKDIGTMYMFAHTPNKNLKNTPKMLETKNEIISRAVQQPTLLKKLGLRAA